MSASTIRFTAADQRAFARLSGDFNPIHLDAAAARRVVAGEPIVHGMHLLLRILDAHIDGWSATGRMRISAGFRHPGVLNESIRITMRDDGALAAEADGVTLVETTIAASAAPSAAKAPRGRTRLRRRSMVRAAGEPATLTSSDINERDGGVLVPPAAAAVRRAFPQAARALGPEIAAGLAAISKLVGMECPGCDSLLSSVTVDVTPHARLNRLTWRIDRFDRRFGLVRLHLSGPGLTGTVDAFLRPRPAPIPTLEAARGRIASATEFTGQRALIVGGSRGLGAATAALIAAAGGVAVATYASGADEIAALRRDAQRAGVAVESLRLDVRARGIEKAVAAAVDRFAITHLYYFATPRIFSRRREPFDRERFDRFAAFYVSGFAAVCVGAAAGGAPIDVFYPSSTAIDESPAELTEYAAAKAAGEIAGRALERQTSGLWVLIHRLPRIATDQTSSILAAPAQDPLDAMLPIVREMHQRRVERQR
jgi:NAD(P)-dependent dehydrogenase (short-subunit alcohol dehydrogenase family)